MRAEPDDLAPPQPQRVVVIGGGAGGLKLAVRLCRLAPSGSIKLTLIDREQAHLWKPRLHEIATGLLVSADEEVSYTVLGARHDFEFMLGSVDGVDLDAREVTVAPVPKSDARLGDAGSELLKRRRVAYDIAVLAVGSEPNDFGTPGVAEHCFKLNTPAEAQQLNQAIMAAGARVHSGEADDLRVAIVGAGTTGVELAAELREAVRTLPQYQTLIDPDRLKITLFDMADRPLAGLASETSQSALTMLKVRKIETRFGSKVERVEPGLLHLGGGETAAADIMVWASGIKGPAITKCLTGLTIEKGGRIKIDSDLRAVGTDGIPRKEFFCIGDCSALYEGKSARPLGATAQVADQQAEALARAVSARLRGRLAVPFRYRYGGTLVSFGGDDAEGDIPAGKRSAKIKGALGKLAYASLYRFHLVMMLGWWRTGLFTMSGMMRQRANPSFKLR